MPPRISAAPSVECGGCEHRTIGDTVQILTPPAVDADGIATVTLGAL